MDAVIFKMTHLQMWLQHAFGDSVACNGLGSWSSCCVYRSLSWDDAGFLALPLAMKGRAESLAALLSLTPGSFEGRCASNISSTVPRCFDLGQEGNSEIWLPHMSLCPCRWYSQLRSKRCRIGLRAPPCTAAASRWCCPGSESPNQLGLARHRRVSRSWMHILAEPPCSGSSAGQLLSGTLVPAIGALLLVFLLRPPFLPLPPLPRPALPHAMVSTMSDGVLTAWEQTTAGESGLSGNKCAAKRHIETSLSPFFPHKHHRLLKFPKIS